MALFDVFGTGSPVNGLLNGVATTQTTTSNTAGYVYADDPYSYQRGLWAGAQQDYNYQKFVRDWHINEVQLGVQSMNIKKDSWLVIKLGAAGGIVAVEASEADAANKASRLAASTDDEYTIVKGTRCFRKKPVDIEEVAI